MELTGEEFMKEIASHSFFKNRYDQSLREFIDQGDQIKYSKEKTDDGQMTLLLDTALHFVKDTHAKMLEKRKNCSSHSIINLMEYFQEWHKISLAEPLWLLLLLLIPLIFWAQTKTKRKNSSLLFATLSRINASHSPPIRLLKNNYPTSENWVPLLPRLHTVQAPV
jgi:hypothetical protein